jgi:peptidoglycan/xylan/chitin deacetylase (PgdA/CDA1 family)
MRFEGHTIGSHGFSHARLDFRKSGRILSEIERTDSAIEKTTGRRPLFFRPPYGRFDPRFKKMMADTEHRLVIWSLLSGDFLDAPPGILLERVLKHLHRGAIIVLHDGHPNAPDMIGTLPEMVRKLKAALLEPKPLDLIGKKTV